MSAGEKYDVDVDELNQDDEMPPSAPVRVVVDGVVATAPAPAIDGAFASFEVPWGAAELVADGDPRRSRLILIAHTANIRIASSREAVMSPSGSAAWWPGVPLELTSRAPVWVASNDQGTTALLSVVTERWAD